MDEQKKGSGAVMWAVVVVVIALGAYGVYKYSSSTSTPVDTTTNPPVTTPVGTTDNTTAMYKDGDYTAIGNYNSPGGAEQINVELTLTSGVITSVTVTNPQTFRPETKVYQGKFIQGVSGVVIGKKITDVKLTRVSGSSLTPKGWNDAIAKIEAQAQA